MTLVEKPEAEKKVEVLSDEGVEITRYNRLSRPLKVIFFLLVVTGIFCAVVFAFSITFGGRWLLLDITYYLILITVFLPSVFLLLRARKKDVKLPWYDIVIALLIFAAGVYTVVNSWSINMGMWKYPTGLRFATGIILILGSLEASRRMGGNIFFGICVVAGFYPLFAQYLPGIFHGIEVSFTTNLGYMAFSPNGILGIVTKTFGEIIIAFLVFAGLLMASGASEFFLNLAYVIAGRFRGGPAKVSVIGSAFFGMLSGSSVSNVVGTGSVTIPAMKRAGYPATFAGAVEACASCGGILMPPVMGSIAFIMAELLGISYSVIIGAAIIPALLYFFALLIQVDAKAAKINIKGMPREEIPSLRKTLLSGWPYLLVMAFLVFGLVYMKWEQRAAWYSAGLLFALSFLRKETMITPRRFFDTIIKIGTLVTQTAAILLPIGIIMNGLIVTGLILAFTGTVVNLGGTSVFLMILAGVVACYIMGMAGLLVPAYILLGVLLAPPIIKIGNLNVIAVHMFILYYSMLASITPPVAAAAFVASTIAKADPMKTSWQAARLGVVIYLVPFFFIYNPALVLQGNLLPLVYLIPMSFLGVALIAWGMEGYVLLIGKINWVSRFSILVGGFLIAFPEHLTTYLGLGLSAVGILIAIWLKRRRSRMTLASV